MEDFLKEINQDIKDIFQYNILTSNTFIVPTRHDDGLTFTIGADKKGKLLETCVLMVDIRNSTKISRQLKKDKVRLGKIYSSFIHAMTNIGDEYGYVRNIIGDRVMVVFEPNDCYVNAINCAALMYTVANKILAKYVDLKDFKVGIGIDFGEMLILKTGIKKKHEEQSEYKSLVWIGDAANTASKLCDFANKDYYSPSFNVVCEELSYERVIKVNKIFGSTFNLGGTTYTLPPRDAEYENKLITKRNTHYLSLEEFKRDVDFGEVTKYKSNKVITIHKKENSGLTSPILISGNVYNGYKKIDPKPQFLMNMTRKDYPESPTTGTGIYGGSIILPEFKNIKI